MRLIRSHSPLDLLRARHQVRELLAPRPRAETLGQSQQRIRRQLAPRGARIQPGEEEACPIAHLLLRAGQ